MTGELLEDRYPSKDQLARITAWEGTLDELFGYVQCLWHAGYGYVEITDFDDLYDRKARRYAFVTGGWSGNESIISELDNSMAYLLAWASTHRGGLHVYEATETKLATVLNPFRYREPCVCGGTLTVAHDE